MNRITAPKVFQSLQHRKLIVLIGASIGVALLLVMASLALYVSSGTAQLDLSRPGYAAIRKKVKSDDGFKGFGAGGKVDSHTLSQFDELYGQKLHDAQSVDAFSSDVLSTKTLQIDAPADDAGDAPATSAP